MDNDIQLAKALVKKIRELLSPKFDYIVQFAPLVQFHESCDELWLDAIVFEADGEYQDVIVVNEDGISLCLEEDAFAQSLFDCKNMADILVMEQGDILELNPEFEESVKKANDLYIKRVYST